MMLYFDTKLLLIFFVLLGGNLNVLAFGEYSFMLLPFISLFVLKNIYFIKGTVLIYSFIFMFGACIPLLVNPVDLLKECIFLLHFLFGFFVFKKTVNIEAMLIFILFLLLIIAMVQWLLPQSESVFSFFLSRFTMPTGLRGASSFFQEPSFYSFFCAVIFLMVWANTNFQTINLKIWFLIFLNLVAAGSSFFIIVFPFMFIALRISLKFKFLISGIIAVVIFKYFELADVSLRFVSVFSIIIDNKNTLDESASARLFYIVKDLKQFIDCAMFLPTLTAGYQASFDLCGSTTGLTHFIYDPFLSGSLLGRYLVQFGILTLVFIFWLFMNLPGKIIIKIVAAIYFAALFIQMIPITLPIVGIGLGFLTHLACKRKLDFGNRPNAFVTS